MRNILRLVTKGNKLVERKINPVQEPKIYQRKPAKRDLYDDQNSINNQNLADNNARTSFQVGSPDMGINVRRNSYVKRRLSVVMDRREAARSEQTNHNEESSSNSTNDEERASHSTNNLASTTGITLKNPPIAQFSQNSLGSINEHDIDTFQGTGYERHSGESSRRSSEKGFLGPAINVSLIFDI